MASRVETNFTRLLHRCESMASEKKFDDWRLEKYVSTLQEYLSELRKLSSNRPPQEVITEYTKKVDFLKGLIETEKLPTPSEKALAAEHLHPVTHSAGSARQTKATASQKLHLQSRARFQEEMRNELLGNSNEKKEGDLRHRKPASSTEEDIDTVLKHHNEIQEKLAEEMVQLARNLKENATIANKIVKEDTKKLGESNKLAESNYGRLGVESERLEAHVQKSCNWWMWIMLGLVCATFIWMVLFMRMFPKR